MANGLSSNPHRLESSACKTARDGRSVRSAGGNYVFSIARHIDLYAYEVACVDRTPTRCQVETNLDEASVILEADDTLHPDGSPSASRDIVPRETPPMT